MSKNLEATGLKSIASQYDLFFIDIWGVIHNGIKLHENAIKVLEELSKNNKEFILLTNAPRPNLTVINTLKGMGLNKFSDTVFTSGEASLRYILKEFKNKKFFHLGPPRDFDLFKKFENNKVNNIDDSEYILCSGLFEEYENDLEYYKKFLSMQISKKMICTNPDLIVDRGNETEFCAGKIAQIFENLGGKVVYFGKPHFSIYNLILKKSDKALMIGDNLQTDIKGANLMNQDSIFITDGIHLKEIRESKNIESIFKKYDVRPKFIQNKLQW